MQLQHITYQGPPVDDAELLGQLPTELSGLLQQINGFIQYNGGLHVRGACQQPDWHSLRAAWQGERAFHRLYPEVQQSDIPFAEDYLGDQFFLRDGLVWQLSAEIGQLNSLDMDVLTFLQQAQADPVEFLALEPLVQFEEDGEKLEPGQLLSCYPPLCTAEAAEGVTLSAVPAAERHEFLADFAAKVREMPDGGTLDMDVTE
jgi:hypothetical protein